MATRCRMLLLVVAILMAGCSGRREIVPFAPTGTVAVDEQAGALAIEAARNLEQGRIEESIEAARQARDRAPTFWLARSLHGIALSQVGRVAESIGEADRGVSLAPNEPFAWYCKGVTYLAAGRGDEAYDALAKSLELGLEPAEMAATARELQSVAKSTHEESDTADVFGLLTKGETKAAVDLAERAIAKAPDSMQGQYALAYALLTAGRPFDAKSAAERALELGHGASVAKVLLGMAHFATGDFATAETLFDEALHTGVPGAMQGAAVALRDSSKRAEAVVGSGGASEAELQERARGGEVICHATRKPTPQEQSTWGFRCLSFLPGVSYQEIAEIDDSEFYEMQVGVKSLDRVRSDDGTRITSTVTLVNGMTMVSVSVIDVARRCADSTTTERWQETSSESRQTACFEEREGGTMATTEQFGPILDPVAFVEATETSMESYRRWLKANID